MATTEKVFHFVQGNSWNLLYITSVRYK